jgi:multiple sugar transport system permease protein
MSVGAQIRTAPPSGSGLRTARASVPGGRRKKHGTKGYLFIAPFLLVFVVLLLVPLGYSFYISLFRTQIVGGTTFVGLTNYRAALSDTLFRSGLARVGRFILVQTPVMLGFALFFALALDSARLRFARLIRLGVFLPYAVPSIVAALMWGYLYGPSFGPFAQIAHDLGTTAPGFLSSQWMLASIGNIVTWEFTGYNMIVIYAALQAIPSELYDAAAVDGAGGIRTAWSVKIPIIRPVLQLLVFFSLIGTFQLFSEPDIMAAIAPTVIGNAYTPNLYAYNLIFTDQEVNYAAAVSFLLAFVILVLSYSVILLTNRRNKRS